MRMLTKSCDVILKETFLTRIGHGAAAGLGHPGGIRL